MKIAVKEVGREVQIIDVSDIYRTKVCKEFTGQDEGVEFVRLNEDGTFALAVNDSALPLELPTNFLISMNNPDFPIQKIVGTAVFVRCKPVDWTKEIWDYEVDDLQPEDYAIIERILGDDYQDTLKKKFKDYGRGYFVWRSL